MPSLAKELHRHRAKHYSQNGEDGVLQRLLEIVGVTNRFCVELGVGSGEECNTRLLLKDGWSGIMIDCAFEDPSRPLYREFVTAENVNALLSKYGAPDTFDVLSTDIDGNDYWVWKAILSRYRPRVAIAEYNCVIPSEIAVAMPYDASFRWTGQPNIGQSLHAVQKLAEAHGYALVYAEPPNAFVVLQSLLPPEYAPLSARQASRTTWIVNRARRRDWNRRLKHLPWVFV
jgi:hypothetical protein